jgi:hypothetical protein
LPSFSREEAEGAPEDDAQADGSSHEFISEPAVAALDGRSAANAFGLGGIPRCSREKALPCLLHVCCQPGSATSFRIFIL